MGDAEEREVLAGTTGEEPAAEAAAGAPVAGGGSLRAGARAERGEPGPAASASDDGGELARRLTVAGLGIPLCVAVTWAGGLAFVAGVALLAGVSAWEFVGLYRRAGGRRPLVVPTVAVAAGFPFLVHAFGVTTAWLAAPAVIMATGAWALAARRPEEGPASTAALTSFGALYLGGLLGFGVPLRTAAADPGAGTLLFFLPVTVTWAADTAAYFGGRRWGRRQLASRMSPNKTWAGAVAATVAGPAAAVAYGLLLLPLAGGPHPALPQGGLGPVSMVVLGLVLAKGAVLGDLVESGLKRECRAKDSSGLLPGHGGLLDRLDSILWAFPLAWLFLWLHP